MNEQLRLTPIARASDPITSWIAAATVAPSAPSLRERCLRALRERGPMTDFELADVVHRAQTSAGVRRGELVKLGLVEPHMVDGKQVRRPAPSGTPALVWRAVS